MVKLETEKLGEPMSLSETPTQLGVSVPMGGFRTFSARANRALPDHGSGHSAKIVPLNPGSPTDRAGSRHSLLD